jgi:hypothetical protein
MADPASAIATLTAITKVLERLASEARAVEQPLLAFVRGHSSGLLGKAVWELLFGQDPLSPGGRIGKAHVTDFNRTCFAAYLANT